MRLKPIFTIFLMLLCLPNLQAGQVEVLHYWTSGGEAAALNVLKQQMAQDGHQWIDFEVAGGGGSAAMEQLQSRVIRGKPPTAAQIKGLDIQRWARLGFLADLSDTAITNDWDNRLPPIIAQAMQYDGKYVSVPVNVHRTNWLWANKPLLDALDIAPPQTWIEFDLAAEKILASGKTVIAMGNQDWQYATLFEAVALSIGGSEFYRQAFIEHNFRNTDDATWQAIFERYHKLLTYVTQPTTEWHEATATVISGEAAFQFMGDWAKGEFSGAQKQPNVDFYCLAVPGTENMFLFNIDSFAMFNLRQGLPAELDAQQALAKNIVSREFQETFNLNKGSIPIHNDIDISRFDICARQSMLEFEQAQQQQTLLPSIAHGMATTGTVLNYFMDSIETLSLQPLDADKAARELIKAIRYGQYVMK